MHPTAWRRQAAYQTFGKGREGKGDVRKFDEEIKTRKNVEAPLPIFAPGEQVYRSFIDKNNPNLKQRTAFTQLSRPFGSPGCQT